MKQKDTPVEKALRSALHRRGHRFRKNARPLPRTRRSADIVFPSSKIAVFVDGCFWHRCPIHGTSPKNNADWWKEKLDANVARDHETDRLLLSAGWLPIRVWEHEDVDVAADSIGATIQTRASARSMLEQDSNQRSSP